MQRLYGNDLSESLYVTAMPQQPQPELIERPKKELKIIIRKMDMVMKITMKIKNLNKILLLIYMFVYGAAFADKIKHMEDSWYIGGALGVSSLNPETPVGSSVTDSKDLSGKIYAGVDISNQIGIEAFWSNFGESKINGSVGNGGIDYSAVGVNGVYHLPAYAGRVHPFAKLGIAKVSTRSTGTVHHEQENNFTVFSGLGAEYDYNQNLKIRAEYEYFTKDISQLSVGVNWAPHERIHYLDSRSDHFNYNKNVSVPAALPVGVVSRKSIPIIGTANQAKVLPIAKPFTRHKKLVKKVHMLSTSISGNSLFAVGSAQLLPSGVERLNVLINKIHKNNFKIYHIIVSGHTDDIGSAKQNIYLSKQRASAVANYLAARGIPRQKMSVIGYGESQPVSDNRTAYGRSLNRRVDIKIKGAETFVVTR